MGSLQAQEMKELLELEPALAWHLAHNHYPPIPSMMIECCRAAINAGNFEEWDELIELPDGIEHKEYGREVPARVLIEYAHLSDFLEE